MNENLQELRKTWEGDAVVVTEKVTNENTLVVIRDTLAKDSSLYRCLRYFKAGEEWAVSCDGNSVPSETVMKWLCAPRASTCRVG